MRAGTRLSGGRGGARRRAPDAALRAAALRRGGATIGGAVATGLSGPRRPYAGAVRDFVLGTRVVNGKGEDLSFGGRVIKNVAGYDVSRLMAGALGTLGVITEISFKVLPLPPPETTLAFELDEAAANLQVNRWAGLPLPLSATAWQDGKLRVRLSGAATAVAAAKAKMGGEEIGRGRLLARPARASAAVLPRGRAAVAPVGAANHGTDRNAARAADRVGRRAALGERRARCAHHPLDGRAPRRARDALPRRRQVDRRLPSAQARAHEDPPPPEGRLRSRRHPQSRTHVFTSERDVHPLLLPRLVLARGPCAARGARRCLRPQAHRPRGEGAPRRRIPASSIRRARCRRWRLRTACSPSASRSSSTSATATTRASSSASRAPGSARRRSNRSQRSPPRCIRSSTASSTRTISPTRRKCRPR